MTRLGVPRPRATGPDPTGSGAAGPLTLEIRVGGHLDDHWATSLGDLVLVRLDDGSTSLTGRVVDQAQLHGVLAGIRDLGVPLLSLLAAHDGTEDSVETTSRP
jgi:hypothetical protein